MILLAMFVEERSSDMVGELRAHTMPVDAPRDAALAFIR